MPRRILTNDVLPDLSYTITHRQVGYPDNWQELIPANMEFAGFHPFKQHVDEAWMTGSGEVKFSEPIGLQLSDVIPIIILRKKKRRYLRVPLDNVESIVETSGPYIGAHIGQVLYADGNAYAPAEIIEE